MSGSTVLHTTSDEDHNRTVITYAGHAEAVVESAVRAARVACERIDLNQNRGVHPRLGAIDVLPFVPLAGASLADCVDLARQTAQRFWTELSLPVYFYEAAASRPERRKLEDVRRGEFEGRSRAVLTDPDTRPDVGGPALHPTAGAAIVGARPFLIAFNINLRTTDLALAKAVARAVRTSSGGLPAVKALGFPLASRNLVQVSMNLTDFETTSMQLVYAEVERLASQHGVDIEESELIGLAPQKALNATIARAIHLRDFADNRIIEHCLNR